MEGENTEKMGEGGRMGILWADVPRLWFVIFDCVDLFYQSHGGRREERERSMVAGREERRDPSREGDRNRRDRSSLLLTSRTIDVGTTYHYYDVWSL
jgi:hypothetical protein